MGKFLGVVITWALSSFLLKLTATIGIGVITYQGVSALITQMIDYVGPLFNSLPLAILQLLAIAQVPEALSILFSAFLTRAAIMSARAFVGVM